MEENTLNVLLSCAMWDGDGVQMHWWYGLRHGASMAMQLIGCRHSPSSNSMQGHLHIGSASRGSHGTACLMQLVSVHL